MLNNFYQRYLRMQGNQNPVNASDVSDDLLSTPSAAFRQAAGSGTLVSGTATIATGLNSVLSFNTILNGPTGFATGATEVSDIIVASITTGSVIVKGTFNAFVTGAATISVSGTGGFFWQAMGT